MPHPWISGVVSIGVLTLFAALNLALRVSSRPRMTFLLERRGRAGVVAFFVARRAQYMLATAAVRTMAVPILFLSARAGFDTSSASLLDSPSISGVASALLVCLVFGVAVPSAWAKYCGEGLVVALLPLLEALRLGLYPVLIFLGLFDPIVRRLAGVPKGDERSYVDELEREILYALNEGEKHGVVGESEKEIIESVIELADARVDKIMTPRTQIAALPIDADWDAVLETIRVHRHSRIPVYENSIDTILGILYVKDLLPRIQDAPLRPADVMRKAQFVPETKSVRDMLREFQERQVHIAIVLDEYGGTAGLVTIEDILEELVGEIADEHDSDKLPSIQFLDPQTVEIDGRTKIHDLNDQLDLNLPEDQDFETIAGFVMSSMGCIPHTGDRFEFENLAFEITSAEPRRVTRVRLHHRNRRFEPEQQNGTRLTEASVEASR